ncbi:acyl-CoA dehydrogenase [Pseudomonadota bacterium DY0742]|jgi:hypothetical protein|uniref:acyl-CoA dehydrogenase n=1 Tax=Stutzerimonas balearica TaxID=74829 RepID=UPI001BC8DA56|nr:acyl-CoA dehydrogenase [Stutzerimonas balearica]MBS4148441.1 acyl-CoA dehydrogenase [Stutzerimonas balearica]
MFWNDLLGPAPPPVEVADLRGWFAELQSAAGADSFRLALIGGRRSATPGLAFLAGYQAALRALWGEAPDGLGALCATEQRQLSPAGMQTRLAAGCLSGSKDFVTAGDAAQWLLVPARSEATGDTPRLALCLLPAAGAGVQLCSGPALPVVPDIPHARLRLDRAPCQVLPGDGWADYVKPFRTHEDIHVLAALGAWLYARLLPTEGPQSPSVSLAALLASLSEIARLPAAAAETHLLLAGAIEQFAVLQDRLAPCLPARLAAEWQRDRAVLGIARQAQGRRLSRALQRLGIKSVAQCGPD